MYRRWLSRERTRRHMYALQLRYTQRELQRRMKAAKSQKKVDAAKISQLNVAMGKLRQSSTKSLGEVKRLVKKLTDANTKAQSTISALEDARNKLKATNKTLAADNKTLSEQLIDCQKKPVSMGAR